MNYGYFTREQKRFKRGSLIYLQGLGGRPGVAVAGMRRAPWLSGSRPQPQPLEPIPITHAWAWALGQRSEVAIQPFPWSPASSFHPAPASLSWHLASNNSIL